MGNGQEAKRSTIDFPSGPFTRRWKRYEQRRELIDRINNRNVKAPDQQQPAPVVEPSTPISK